MNDQNNNPVTPEAPQTPVTPPNDGKMFSIAALVLGIIGAVGGWLGYFGFVALACAILGIVFGVKGRAMSLAATGKVSGLATAGFVLGIIGTVLAGIGVLVCTACTICFASVDAAFSSLFIAL